MKKANLGLCLAALVMGAGLFTATFPAAGQSILIDINQANVSAVQFIATVNGSVVNDASQFNLFGVDLISYFTTAPAAVAGAATGNLIPAGTTAAYTEWIPDSFLGAGRNVDLNLYNTSNPQTQVFSTSIQALTNTAIINLSSLLADLPTTGTSGPIYSGYSRSAGVQIGSWVVVPEPSAMAQLALGAMVFAGLALVRRARHVAARR